jgi:hypothetical protein
MWDIMSAQNTHQFVDTNFVTAGGGPGMSAPGLFQLGWIPANNRKQFQIEDVEQKYKLRALSRPRGADPLMVWMSVGGADPFDGIYTIEYRQGDGWDRGFVTSGTSPQKVRSSGGTVLVHAYRPAGAPTSKLINGVFAGALQPCDTLVLPGSGGLKYHVTVESFDIRDGSANIEVGSGRGRFFRCASDTLRINRVLPTRSHTRSDDIFFP